MAKLTKNKIMECMKELEKAKETFEKSEKNMKDNNINDSGFEGLITFTNILIEKSKEAIEGME